MTATFVDLLGEMFRGETRSLDAGGILFREGDPASHLCSVLDGQVRLERYSPEGRTVLLQTARAGESFAEAALFHDRYHCNATATMASRVLLVPREKVLEAIRTDLSVAEKVIVLLAAQVRELRSRLELRNILSARDRILHYLLMSASEKGEVPLRSSLKDLAAELGLAHETLYRELSAMEKEGLLAREDGLIRLLDARRHD